MADISSELQAIMDAVYGEEVRGSIHDAIDAINTAIESAINRQLLVIDSTLSVSNQAADAAVAGTELSKRLSLAYGKYTDISSESNLNSYAGTAGNFKIDTVAIAQTISNIPAPYPGRLFVFPAGSQDGGLQIYVTSYLKTGPMIFIRGWRGSTWTPWSSDLGEISDLKKALVTGFSDSFSGSSDSYGFHIPYKFAPGVKYIITVSSNYSSGRVLLLKNNTFSSVDLVKDFTWSSSGGTFEYLAPVNNEILYIGIRTLSSELTQINATVSITADSILSAMTNKIEQYYDQSIKATGASFVYSLEAGGLYRNNGVVRNDTSADYYLQRARTNANNPISLSTGDIVRLTDTVTYRFGVMYLDDEDEAQWTGWLNSDYIATYDGDHWITIRRNNNATASVSELREHLIVQKNGGYLDKRVDKIDNRLATVEDGNIIPDYYYENDYLPNKIDAIQKAMNFNNGVCFAFITDTHWPNNAGKSRPLLSEIFKRTTLPFCIFGGDAAALIGDDNTVDVAVSALISYSHSVGESKWFPIRGNHDLYCRTNETPATFYTRDAKEIYNIMFRERERYVSNLDRYHLGYCIDLPFQRTRFVMLNSTDSPTSSGDIVYTTDQMTWLVTVLNELSNTKIIVVSHISSDPVIAASEASLVTKIQEILIAFKTKGSVTINGTSYSFAGNTNSLVMQLSGHTHRDTYNVDNGILAIATTCDAAYTDDGEGMVQRTITEQAFDIYFIDYDTSIVKTIRIGRGQDRTWSFNL